MMLPQGRYDDNGRVAVYVAPDGADFGDGTRDYPVRSIDRALRLVRETRIQGEPAIVWLNPGTYVVRSPLELGVRDSQIELCGLDSNNPPRIMGSFSITSWTERPLANGVTAWTAPLPQGIDQAQIGRVAYGPDGRLHRPRFPATGALRIQSAGDLNPHDPILSNLFDGTDRFTVEKEALASISDFSGVDAVVSHFWLQERLPIERVDRETGEVRTSLSSVLALADGGSPEFANVFFDGVGSQLGHRSGEWILDRTGELINGLSNPTIIYVPKPDDVRADFVMRLPLCSQFLKANGTIREPLRDIVLRDLTIEGFAAPRVSPAHPPFQMREDPYFDEDSEFASDPQGASQAPGVIEMSYVHRFSADRVRVRDCGGYAFRLDAGTRFGALTRLSLKGLGAGGCAIAGGNPNMVEDTCHHIRIADCVISGGGEDYGHCAAVLIRYAHDIVVSHNEISQFPQTGVSVGWRWDYGESPSFNNRVEFNHIHHLGGGETDWFGAIYTLGVSPGTVIRGNYIHDVVAGHFGGWGILIDPATAHVVIEKNMVTRTSDESIHIKSGRENIVRDNVFLNSEGGLVSLAVSESHSPATFIHNVFVPGKSGVYVGVPGSVPVSQMDKIISDANVLVAPAAKAVWASDIIGMESCDRSGDWCASHERMSRRLDPHALHFAHEEVTGKVSVVWPGYDSASEQCLLTLTTGPC